MSERRAPRLILEVVYLAALAVATSFAGLRAWEVVGVMLLGWLIVAIFEWGALRGRSHYGSGKPARWYVPQFSLPPPRPLEQFSAYPTEASAGEVTWIASPAMLAEWPVAEEPVIAHEPLRIEEETQVHDVLEVERALAVADRAVEIEPEPLPEPVAEPEPEPVLAPAAEAAAAEDGPVTFVKHRIDPLDDPQPKGRRFGRRAVDDTIYVEVPDRPEGSRLLPSRSRSED